MLSVSSGVRARRNGPRTNAPSSTRWLTRSGWRAAYAIEIAPPCDVPSNAKRSSPAASGFEIRDQQIEGDVGRFACRQPAPARVVAVEPIAAAERVEPRAPHRRLPVALDVRQPVRGAHERVAVAVRRVGKPRPIRRVGEANVLLERGHEAGCTASGTRRVGDEILDMMCSDFRLVGFLVRSRIGQRDRCQADISTLAAPRTTVTAIAMIEQSSHDCRSRETEGTATIAELRGSGELW